jgi:hypothetical protein
MLTTKEKKYSNKHPSKKLDKNNKVVFLDTILQFKDLMTGSKDSKLSKEKELLKKQIEEFKKKNKKKKSD